MSSAFKFDNALLLMGLVAQAGVRTAPMFLFPIFFGLTTTGLALIAFGLIVFPARFFCPQGWQLAVRFVNGGECSGSQIVKIEMRYWIASIPVQCLLVFGFSLLGTIGDHLFAQSILMILPTWCICSTVPMGLLRNREKVAHLAVSQVLGAIAGIAGMVLAIASDNKNAILPSLFIYDVASYGAMNYWSGAQPTSPLCSRAVSAQAKNYWINGAAKALAKEGESLFIPLALSPPLFAVYKLAKAVITIPMLATDVLYFSSLPKFINSRTSARHLRRLVLDGAAKGAFLFIASELALLLIAWIARPWYAQPWEILLENKIGAALLCGGSAIAMITFPVSPALVALDKTSTGTAAIVIGLLLAVASLAIASKAGGIIPGALFFFIFYLAWSLVSCMSLQSSVTELATSEA